MIRYQIINQINRLILWQRITPTKFYRCYRISWYRVKQSHQLLVTPTHRHMLINCHNHVSGQNLIRDNWSVRHYVSDLDKCVGFVASDDCQAEGAAFVDSDVE